MKGIIGTPTIPEKINTNGNILSNKSKRNKEEKLANKIISLINDGKTYKEVGKALKIKSLDVVKIYESKTLIYKEILNENNIKHMLKNELTTKEIAEYFNIQEFKVIAVLKNVDYNLVENIKEINIAIEVKDMLDKSINFSKISKRLNIDRYKAFIIYNKYFDIYRNDIIDVEVINKLEELKLSTKLIAKFYNVEEQQILNLKEMSIQIRNSSVSDKKVHNGIKEDLLKEGYEKSNKMDFYACKY